MGGKGYYTVGNNAIYVQFKRLRVLRKKILNYCLFIIHFPTIPTFQEPLVYMLRYKFREAADLQGGATDLQGGGGGGWQMPPPPKCGPVTCTLCGDQKMADLANTCN